MLVSARWINDYLDPPATADEVAELLTRAGFPLEEREDVAGDDVRMDFEMTSNRGDCVCHVGLAREIAAISGRALRMPDANPRTNGSAGPAAADLARVTNREPQRCPLYTGRVIRGVTVGPSPDWLAERLIARGDIPRNNVVDLTNFVLFELGQPTHVFDLAKLQGPEIIVRLADAGESFLPLGEGATPIELDARDLVIADAAVPVALAGVKGGGLSAVTDATTDILIEAATFDPVAVRSASRRHNIASESSYRFERGVHPEQVNPAAERLAALILDVAGGTLCDGVLADGGPMPDRRNASMRTQRCREILGVAVSDPDMLDALDRLGFAPKLNGGEIHCTVPVHRLDIAREADLIEEVARMHGLDRIPVQETLQVRVAAPQPEVAASRAVNGLLAGLGYVETVTHSLISDEAAARFLPPGAAALRLADAGAAGEPTLRPALLPSLLRVRAHNQANGVGALSLFEKGATWYDLDGPQESVRLGLLHDVTADADGLRPLRGVLERIAHLLLGPDAALELRAADDIAWLDAVAYVQVNGAPLGWIGRVAPAVAAAFELDHGLLAAEVGFPQLYEAYPPLAEARALPSFPAIERDISAIVDETVSWKDMRAAVTDLRLEHLEALEFVTIYRGRPIPEGKKSLTARLRFRSTDRTLTRVEIDPLVDRAITTLQERFAAEVRH